MKLFNASSNLGTGWLDALAALAAAS